VKGRRVTLALCGVFTTAGAAASQQRTSPPADFRYTTGQLDCAAFHERSRAQLDAQTGIRQRHETLTRDGVWRMRARSGAAGMAIEAWYDSLALSRESPEGKLVPDTDGLLGGRYRGALSPAGHYTAEARPFVPDDVAEVADLGGAMEDLLPPLPPGAISVGQRWSDSSGLELRRLPDSVAGRRVVRRLEVHARTEADQATVRGDTTRLSARQVSVENGRIDWDPAIGLLRRVRRLVVETSVPAGGPLRQPLRSRLEQEGTLVRVGGKCAMDRSPSAGAESP
jgi:hypothetical protein